MNSAFIWQELTWLMSMDKKTRITFLGDIFPAELAYTRNYGIRTQFEKHGGKPWVKQIKDIVGEKDLLIANLESPLVNKKDIIKDTFYGHPSFTSFLRLSGIDFVNVANNHILEQGSKGFRQTIDFLEKAKIGIVGHQENGRSKISYIHLNGLKIAMAGFSNVDLEVIKDVNHFAILREDDVIEALSEMEKEGADFKILNFHWGNEYVHIPSITQRRMAYKFIESGADVIIGHHPHVIQPYEKYKDGHIFYSLGNFMFDYIHSKMISIGLVASLEIDALKRDEVNLRGVKLSYKNTVAPMPQLEFENFYAEIKNLYSEFCKMSDDDYQIHYNRMHKKNRFRRRVAMKTSILSEFFNVPLKHKSLLIKNVFSYYLKK